VQCPASQQQLLDMQRFLHNTLQINTKVVNGATKNISETGAWQLICMSRMKAENENLAAS